MNVGIDYRLAKTNPHSGMGVYVSQITKNLARVDDRNKYVLLGNRNIVAQKSLGKLTGLLKELVWVNLGILNSISEERIDLFYCPNPPSPLFSPVPVILTIPDLSFIKDSTMNPFLRFYLFVVYFLSAQRASEITTFSLNSKHDISKVLKVPGRKIIVISPAVETTFTKRRVREQTFNKYGIRKKYILAVPGSFIPRKNVLDLVMVFSSLPLRLKKEYCLVLVGNKEDGYFRTFYETIKNVPDIKRIVFTGYVSEKELIELYSGASMLVSTSLYEGFGLPPLEAMACGTPVIAYRNSSLPEVIGEAGILVENKRELRKAMLNILTDLSVRKRLVELGHVRVRTFSWKKSAYNLLKIINEMHR